MKKKAQYKYYTVDGHLMKRGETMWRVCNSTGDVFKEPELLVFHALTGYNHDNISENPYDENHIHFYSVRKAVKWIEENEGKKADFEILSFLFQNRNIWSLTKDGGYSWNGYPTYPLSYLLKMNSYKIHSVKRLSDGEVFTVGDYTTGGTIKQFRKTELEVCGEKKEDFIHITYEHDLEDTNYPNFRDVQLISGFKKKQKLFTTEDGVDIYVGDKVWFVNPDNNYELQPNSYTVTKNWDDSDMLSKVFSTKKAAEEYILMNKPCLSINDIKNNLGGYERTTNGRFYITIEDAIIELAKSKLK
jgi:hypothetical protein